MTMSGIVPNRSCISEFLILGFYDSPKIPLFLLFLLMYLFTVLNNFLIIVLIYLETNLHKPMYFFLCNMSILDILYTSVTAPNLLYIILSENNRISFGACITQLFMFNSLGTVEYMLLTSMAYDRYQAICNPLGYHRNLNEKSCLVLSGGTWLGGFIASLPINISIGSLCYCLSNQIDHIYCDLTPLLKLACDDTSPTNLLIFVEGNLIGLTCFIFTVTSYVFIIRAILKVCNVKGRVKAFSTCASHLTVVILFYVLIACMYMKPTSSNSLHEEKILSVLFVNIIPIINPVIYTLRNNDVKEAVKKIIHGAIIVFFKTCKICI